MEYFIESTNLALLKIDNEYRLLCEASNRTNSEEEKKEISIKSNNLIKRAWDKVKILIQRIKDFFTKNKIKKKIDDFGKRNEKCEIKVPEGETPKSFHAKIDLFMKKLKNKKLTKEEIESMKSKMVKGVMVTSTTVIVASLGKKLMEAIPVCDRLVAEYDNEKLTQHNLSKKNEYDERTSHVNKYKQKYKEKIESGKSGSFPGYVLTHIVTGLLSVVQDGIGHVVNSIDSKNDKNNNLVKYKDMSVNQRIEANKEIKKQAKIKAASAKDKMNTYREAMHDLKSDGKEHSIEYSTYNKKYNQARDEYKKYKHIYSNK